MKDLITVYCLFFLVIFLLKVKQKVPRYFFNNDFLRQQQLHAQQAAHYIWGKTDISSHSTVPMLSSLLMLFLKICSVLTNSKDDEIGEPSNLLIMNLWNLCLWQILKHTQFDNYYYHDSSQSYINFFDLVQCYCIENRNLFIVPKMATLDWEHFAQCSFKQEHQLSKTHEIQILILGMALNFLYYML